MKYKDEYVKAKVGLMSLIGVGEKLPTSWGNYFCIYDGPRILNMWAENLEDAVEKFLLDGLVKIRNYGEVAIIIDDRIPHDYFYNKCCFTSTRCVSLEIAQDIYKTLGDPTNELLRFINPKEYHELRGETYKVCDNGMILIGTPIKAGNRKLSSKWKCELKEDVVMLFSPSIRITKKQ
jgi:hypothetical protein